MAVALPDGDNWVGLFEADLPVAEALAWAVRDETGALVSFCGTVRDHSEARDAVTALEYEAYDAQVTPRLEAIVAAARARWPEVSRVACWHRTGRLELGEVSVLVVVSSPHREEAFAAARYVIDTVKASVPIWKREHWAGGSDWALDAHELTEVEVHSPARGGRR